MNEKFSDEIKEKIKFELLTNEKNTNGLSCDPDGTVDRPGGPCCPCYPSRY